MIALPPRSTVVGLGLFCLAYSVLLFIRMLPLAPGMMGWPGPDMGLALILAWVLRRPDQLPALAIVLVVLLEDLLLMRPPGLWAIFVLLGSEAARQREHRWRDTGFMVEWLRVGVLVGLMMLAYRMVLILFLLPVSNLGQVILQYLATVAAYPVAVFAARWLLGLRRIRHGEGA
ncbi:rod shape-determining protein MreD [Paracoccus sp. 1_MG-2023]|uniref:rod shape-determining protein MreD n=1 Tax=unclassified Paracoccus (in: a-proteobacteria) TaxID=2688777 RepID=UPI001C08AA5A|nr:MULTISPECIES: rod shape-determining protein MreD [unclassified Paracoccus (in: a-proteobacteria)]MBU2956479.1 rod shape-determining protein MreD [Paracoccus sp. C2R09]MDO6669717.1 rod shape-determining protein MreD [Paracoccus sp. 1_MG-2023]